VAEGYANPNKLTSFSIQSYLVLQHDDDEEEIIQCVFVVHESLCESMATDID